MRTTWRLGVLLAALAAAGASGCDNSPSASSDASGQASPTSQPAAAGGAADAIPDTPMMADLRRRAEKGDVPAMASLAYAYESRGRGNDRALARQWYEKAAAAGDQGAKESLRMLDAIAGSSAAPAPASQPSGGGPADASAGAGTSLLAPGDLTDSMASGGVSFPTSAPAADATAPAATEPAALRTTPSDPAKLSWDDILHSFDMTGVVTGEQKTRDGQFVGVATAKDRTLVLGAMGPTADNLQHVRAVIRIKNKRDPNSSPRVGQMTAMADMITRGNVSRTEMGEWVANYLRTQQKSEPIFRNGWRIQITGPEGDGVRDRFDYIGAAVVVELKK